VAVDAARAVAVGAGLRALSQHARSYAAGSGSAALEVIEDEPVIDLALIDFATPGMNGAEVARRIQPKRPNLPILFVTGFADRAALVGVSEAQIVGKPFVDDELTQKFVPRSPGLCRAKWCGFADHRRRVLPVLHDRLAADVLRPLDSDQHADAGIGALMLLFALGELGEDRFADFAALMQLRRPVESQDAGIEHAVALRLHIGIDDHYALVVLQILKRLAFGALPIAQVIVIEDDQASLRADIRTVLAAGADEAWAAVHPGVCDQVLHLLAQGHRLPSGSGSAAHLWRRRSRIIAAASTPSAICGLLGTKIIRDHVMKLICCDIRLTGPCKSRPLRGKAIGCLKSESAKALPLPKGRGEAIAENSQVRLRDSMILFLSSCRLVVLSR
jgi:CheY-like chemotaxis protein